MCAPVDHGMAEHGDGAELMEERERQRHDEERASRCRARPGRRPARRASRRAARGGVPRAWTAWTSGQREERDRRPCDGRTARSRRSRRGSARPASAMNRPDGTSAPSISGQVLKMSPASRPGDQAAEKDLEEDQRDDQRRRAREAPALAGAPRRREPARHPQHIGEDRAGERQVDREPVLADVGALGEAARHHPPADRALQAAEDEDAGELAARARRSIRPVAQKKTSGSRKTTPITRPRSRCAHSHQKMPLNSASVMPWLRIWYSGICWYLANSSCHSAVVERRDDAVDRLPLGDRQAGMGEPRGAADDDHRDDQQRDDIEPRGGRAPGRASGRAAGGRSAASAVAMLELARLATVIGHWRI